MIDSAKVLGKLYASALDNTFFDTVLDILSSLLPETGIMLIGQDARQTSGCFLLHRGLNSDAVTPCITEMTVENPWLKKLWQRKEGDVYKGETLMSHQDLRASNKARNWLAVIGPMDCATGVVLNRRGTRQLVLEVRFPETQCAQLRRNTAMILDELAPHLVRAAQFMHLSFHHPLETQLTDSILELFPFAMLIVDAEFRVHHINQRGEFLAEKMETFFVNPEGMFHAFDLEIQARLRELFQQQCNGQSQRDELISLPNTNSSKRHFLSVTKLGNLNQRQMGLNNIYEKPSARFALVIQDTKEPLKLTHQALWSAFRLTNAESELATLLLEGSSVGECAHRQNLAKQTLRNHLSSIMKKTQTHRQPQLTTLLTRLALATTP